MKRIVAGTVILCLGVSCVPAGGQSPAQRLPNAPIKPVPADRLAGIVKAAPAMPADLDLGLKLRLIDYIDCTDPADPHDFRDQGTSRVVSGPAGKYRTTAPHRHAFFSYAFKTAGRDRPVLLVIEYPDDARRTTAFMTHDSMRPGQPHLSFSQEVGVYGGDPLPLTNKMQYATVYAWPQDDWSPILVMNWTRFAGGGVARRVWVYAIDEMPPLKIDEPDPARPRTVDAFFCLAFLMTRDNFGWQSGEATRHMCRYMKHIGVNRITMMCYANQGWGAMCAVPAWDIADDKGYLDNVLKAMDEEGGVGLILGIVAPGMYGKVLHKGKDVAALEPEEFQQVMIQGFDQLIDRYGKYKSMKGFALGSMEALGFYDMLAAKGAAKDVVAHIKQRRGDFEVMTYVGPWHLQAEYFDGSKGPAMWDVIARWETSGQPWSEFLGDEVLKYLKGIKNDPAAMKAVPGLNVYEKYTSEDHRAYELYRQQPRSMVYWDVDRSQRRSDHAATPYASLFDQFDEGWIGLRPNVNFWQHKDWTAPSTSPGMPYELTAYSRMLAHRDRLAVSAGTWTNKYFGAERGVRQFAKVFRSLPATAMTDVPCPVDTVKVRYGIAASTRHVCAVSLIPFASEVNIDGAKVALGPYEIASLSSIIPTPGPDAPAVRIEPTVDAQPCDEYRQWLQGRIVGFEKLCAEVRALNAEAAPEAYTKAAADARKLLSQGKLYAADVALGPGLVNEIRLRKELLDPPALSAPKIDQAPPMTGDLDAWPKAASDTKAETGEHLAGHIFFPNSWSGPKDLSARLRLAHDGTRLYVGLEVRDDVVHAKDGASFMLSKAGYLEWRGGEAKADLAWTLPSPAGKDEQSGTSGGFRYVMRKTAAGYVIEGSAALADLGVAPGGAIGFRAMVADVDNSENLKYTLREGVTGWARKQGLVIPYQQNFTYWSDARNCGRLVLGR